MEAIIERPTACTEVVTEMASGALRFAKGPVDPCPQLRSTKLRSDNVMLEQGPSAPLANLSAPGDICATTSVHAVE
jgi:hypothetical protein